MSKETFSTFEYRTSAKSAFHTILVCNGKKSFKNHTITPIEVVDDYTGKIEYRFEVPDQRFTLGCYTSTVDKPTRNTWLSQRIFAVNPNKESKLDTITVWSDDLHFFYLDRSITNLSHAVFIQLGLNRLFGGNVRLHDIFDGRHKENYNGKYITYIKLHDLMTLILGTEGSNVTRTTSSIKAIENEHFMEEDNEILQERDEQEEYKENVFDFELACNRVRVLRELNNGTLQLDYNNALHRKIALGLSSNLIYIKGGTSKLKSIFLAQKDYRFREGNMISYAKACGYRPIRLKNYSPFVEDHKYRNIYDATVFTKTRVDKLEQEQNLISAEMGREMMREAFNNALKKKGVHLIKSSVGLGKTSMIKELNQCTIAFPNHNLIREFMEKNPKEYATYDNIPNFQNNEYNEKIKTLYSKGLYNEVDNLIDKIATGYTLDASWADVYRKSKLKVKKMQFDSQVPFLCTHSHAVHFMPKHRTLIVDEDIMGTVLKKDSIRVSDIVQVMNDVDDPNAKKELISVIEQVMNIMNGDEFVKGKYMQAPKLGNVDTSVIKSSILKSTIDVPIMDFLNSHIWYRDKNFGDVIHFIKKNAFPSYETVIILSATANENIYKSFFSDISVVDITNVKHKGQIKQINDLSYSRLCIKRNMPLVQELVKQGYNTISFKNFGLGSKIWYFGNAAGTNAFEGMDLTIIGTPHLHESVYIMTALACNKITIGQANEAKMKSMVVEFNGYRFKFHSFENDQIRDIQLNAINGELVQAIGRARLIDNDVKVTVYSNFPMRQAII